MTAPVNTLLAVAIAAALAGCASEEVKQSAPAPVASAAPAPRAAQPARPAPAPQASVAARPAPAASGAPDKRSVYYDFDKYDVKSEYRAVIEANAKYLANTKAPITIEGNCDERGSREYNLALGQRRADSVKSLMKLLGVPESRIDTVSYGEEKPVASGHDEAAWSKNRRSDIVYK